MKVKLFYDNNYEYSSIYEMEDRINKFVIDKEVVDIKMTSEGARNGHSYMIMVIYK